MIKDTKGQEIRYSFEEVKKMLYKQAYRIREKFSNQYEVDELVNEVWTTGSIQKLDNIKFVPARAYYDMIDYIRKVRKRRFMRKGVFYKTPKQITNMHNIKDESKSGYNKNDFFHILRCREKNHIDVISDKEEVEKFLSCLSYKKADVLRKYFLEGKALKEIGAIYGITDPAVYKIKQKALEEIRFKYLISEGIKKKEKIVNDIDNAFMEEILPEFVVDFETDNQYALEENFVLGRDWER